MYDVSVYLCSKFMFLRFFMIRLSTRRLRPGMVTAQSVYNRSGGSYLTRGTVITPQYIDKLKRIGISHITVTSADPSLNLPPPEDIVNEKTREEAIHRVYKAYTTLEKGGKLDIDPLAETAESIISDLLSNKSNLVQMTDLRLYDDYTFAHSVNVAVLSTMIGITCKLSHKDLTNLTIGALLHDVGKIDIPISILNKPFSLSDDEFALIRNHPLSGYDRIMNLDIKHIDLRPLAMIACQHHEHLDGNGYPYHLKGGQVHRLARMVAIADVYDALTTARSYKRAYSPYVASKIMTKCSGLQFDKELLTSFLEHVALYPVGTVLKTDLGYGIVKKIRIGLTNYPLIVIFADKSGDKLTTPVTIDTAEAAHDFINGVVEEQQLLSLVYHLKMDPAILIADEFENE